MTDAPTIRAESSAAQRIAELEREVDAERSTRVALDAEIARLKAVLREIGQYPPADMCDPECNCNASRARRALETP